MSVLLKEIPVMWLTCAKTVDLRRDGMLRTLEQAGLIHAEEMSGPVTSPYNIGVALNYLRALNRHAPPFMILEDDARIIPGNFRSRLEIPDGIDALYLGTSTYGRWKGLTVDGSVIASREDGDYLRVFNMLALHAVLYLEKRYVDHVAGVMQAYLERPSGACDDLVADTMHRHRVLCLSRPMFFQDDGKANRCTTEAITPVFT